MIVGLYTLFLIAEVYLMQNMPVWGRARCRVNNRRSNRGKEKIMFDYETLRFIWWLLIG